MKSVPRQSLRVEGLTRVNSEFGAKTNGGIRGTLHSWSRLLPYVACYTRAGLRLHPCPIFADGNTYFTFYMPYAIHLRTKYPGVLPTLLLYHLGGGKLHAHNGVLAPIYLLILPSFLSTCLSVLNA